MSLRKIFLVPLIYIVMMAAGMAILHYGFGYSYGGGEWMNVLVFVELVLSAYTIYAVRRYSSWRESGFGAIDLKGFLWVLPILLAMIYLIVKAATLLPVPLSHEQIRNLWLIAFTTLLVGFSEETMFRGILLNWSLRRFNVIVSVLLSSVAFSLLHSVNFLGGEDLQTLAHQLVSTFLLGLFLALLALRVKNIVPLIFFHALWDFFILSSSMLKVPTENLGIAMIFPIYYQIIATILMGILTIYFFLRRSA